jgi:hypothetical protein
LSAATLHHVSIPGCGRSPVVPQSADEGFGRQLREAAIAEFKATRQQHN